MSSGKVKQHWYWRTCLSSNEAATASAICFICLEVPIYLLVYFLLEPSSHKLGSIRPHLFCIGVPAADLSLSPQTQQPLWRHAPLLCADVPGWPLLTPGTGRPSRQGCWDNMLLFTFHCQRQVADSCLLGCVSKSLHRGHNKQKQQQESKYKESMWWHLTCTSVFLSNPPSDLVKCGPEAGCGYRQSEHWVHGWRPELRHDFLDEVLQVQGRVP